MAPTNATTAQVFALDIKGLRAARGLTQVELGALLGLSQKSVSRLEVAPEMLRLSQFSKILRVLGYSFHLNDDTEWEGVHRQTSASVYIWPHDTLPAVKIGKSRSLEQRAESVDGVTAVCATELVCASEKVAFRLERTLHRTFHKWRLSSYDAGRMGLGESGASEWFHRDCLERLIEFVRANQDLLGFQVERVPLPLWRGCIP